MKKVLKRTVISLLVIILIFELGLLVTGNMFINKVLRLTIFSGKTGPDIDEVDLFTTHKIETDTPQPWPTSADYNKKQIPEAELGQMITYQTVAFLVVRNDSLLYEKYWEGCDEHALVNSFSMAKSINAALIGCAIKDGLIKSVDEPVSNYLEGFREGAKSGITIRHLLTMSSGIDFKEDYVSPFAWPAEAYYGPDVNGLTLKATVKQVPGKVWQYKGGDSQLLGMVLKKATGKTVAEYATEKLWKPLGAEDKACWSVDDKDMEKVSCCFYTNARDYARIARLYLNYGNWNGKQLIDSSYIIQSLTPASDLVDIDDGKNIYKYGYQWWLLKYKEHKIFYMRGIRGQYVFAIPDLHMIVVRLGHKRAPKTGDDLPADIYTYLDIAMGMK
jgi:CubicO group peptidase (beta-lactamase class C family)